MKTLETLNTAPFRHLIMTIGELPTSFLDSMTYYEMLAWLCNYVEKNVIPAVNNNAEAVKEIQDWIETLDLQDEVDHKLDEMADSGELAEIIAQYLNSQAIQGFDSVADMKEAENLLAGSYARTYGFRNVNDGGSAIYKIREVINTDTVDEMSLIALSDENLVAELCSEVILPETLGAYADGTHDDSSYINKLIELADAGKKISFSPTVYAVNSTVMVEPTNRKLSLDFNGCVLKALSDITVCKVDAYNIHFHQNGMLRNLQIDCNEVASVGLEIYYSWRITYENINITGIAISGKGLWVSGARTESHASGGNIFNNIRGEGCGEAQFVENTDYNTFIVIDAGDNTFSNLDYMQVKRGIDVNRFSIISNAHGFVGTEKRYIDSYFMKLTGGMLATNIYPDTQQFAFINNTSATVNISNCLLTFNSDDIDSEITTLHPSYTFVATGSGKNNIKVNGLQINNNVQTLYLSSTTEINGVTYYKQFLVADMVGSSYTSISYDVSTMYIQANPDATSLVTFTSKCNNKVAYIDVTILDTTGEVTIGNWYSGIFKNYGLHQGYYPCVFRRPSTGPINASYATVGSTGNITIHGSFQANDHVYITLPVFEKQVSA